MAKRNPAAFEALRKAIVEEVIDKAPSARQERLRRLQWRLDMESATAPTPMAACLRISEMMWAAMLGSDGLRDRLNRLFAVLEGERVEDPERSPAQVYSLTERIRERSRH
jgi:hypothetical protein